MVSKMQERAQLFVKGGGIQEAKFRKIWGFPGASPLKSLKIFKNLQLKGGGRDPSDSPPPVHGPEVPNQGCQYATSSMKKKVWFTNRYPCVMGHSMRGEIKVTTRLKQLESMVSAMKSNK